MSSRGGIRGVVYCPGWNAKGKNDRMSFRGGIRGVERRSGGYKRGRMSFRDGIRGVECLSGVVYDG